MGLEVEKLRLEIEEKKRAAEKENSRIVVATLDEIKTYSGRINIQASAGGSRARGTFIYGGTLALLVIVFAGLFTQMRDRSSLPAPEAHNPYLNDFPPRSDSPAAPPPPTKSHTPETPEEGEDTRLTVLSQSIDAVNRVIESTNSSIGYSGLVLRGDVERSQKRMNQYLALASNALSSHQLAKARNFERLATKELNFLKHALGLADESTEQVHEDPSTPPR